MTFKVFLWQDNGPLKAALSASEDAYIVTGMRKSQHAACGAIIGGSPPSLDMYTNQEHQGTPS